MKVLVVHPQGNENVRAVLNGLSKTQALKKYITGLGYSEKSFWIKTSPNWIKAQLHRRTYSLETNQIEAHPAKEIIRLIHERYLGGTFFFGAKAWYSIDSCWNEIDRKGARYINKYGYDLSHVYAYEDAAMDSFIEAKKKKSNVFTISRLVITKLLKKYFVKMQREDPSMLARY